MANSPHPNQKIASAADLLSAARRMKSEGKAPPPGHTASEPLFVPFLPDPATGEWGRWCRIKRLSPTEGLILVGRVREGLRAMNPQTSDDETLRAMFLSKYGAPELDSRDEQEKWLHSCWLLSMGCEDPALTFDDAAQWMTNTVVDDVPVGDAADFLQFHIASLNEESPGLTDLRGGLATLRKLPAAFLGVERAYNAGEQTLRAYLESDDEAAKFVSRWGDVITAVALEKLRQKADIYAQANAKAIVGELIDSLLPMLFGAPESGAADS